MGEVKVHEICYRYDACNVLKDVSFEAKHHEYIYILGPNGAGKSTLFRCILGRLKVNQGSIWINQKPLQSYKSKELAKKIAYIPQNCQPVFNYTVLQLAMMGRTAYLSAFERPREKDYECTYKVLKYLGLENQMQCGIQEISGGERQLVMIARALVQEAEILIMDEPTSNLDYGNQIRLQQQMKKLAASGLLIFQASHHPEHALIFADRIIALEKGKVIAQGKAKETITTELLHRLYHVDVQIQHNKIIPKIG